MPAAKVRLSRLAVAAAISLASLAACHDPFVEDAMAAAPAKLDPALVIAGKGART